MLFPDLNKEETAEAMKDPQVGDRFSEMVSFWVYVIHRDGNLVTTIEGSPPITFPTEGEVKTMTVAEFSNRFHNSAGYWVRLHDRGNDVTGWYEWRKRNEQTEPGN